LKGKHLYLIPMAEMICSEGKDKERFLPSVSDAAVMWASSLGSTQTTPSISTQAAPAPPNVLDTQVIKLSAWLEFLTNRVMERRYDC